MSGLSEKDLAAEVNKRVADIEKIEQRKVNAHTSAANEYENLRHEISILRDKIAELRLQGKTEDDPRLNKLIESFLSLKKEQEEIQKHGNEINSQIDDLAEHREEALTEAAKAQAKAAQEELKSKKEEAGLLSKLFPTFKSSAEAAASSAKAAAETAKALKEKGVKETAKAGTKATVKGPVNVASWDVGAAAKKGIGKVLDDNKTTADWIVFAGFIFHIYTGIFTSWTFNEIPRAVITWEFSLVMILIVLTLLTMKNVKEKFSKITTLTILFILDWQWGNIVNLLVKAGAATSASWYVSKLIWPTWVIGGIILALRSGDRRSFLTKFALGALILFWVLIGISQSGIAGAVYEFGGEGISEEAGAAGVAEVGEKAIEAILGPELLRQAKDVCFKQGDFTSYRPEILGRSECTHNEYRRLLKEAEAKAELERITKARRDLIDKDKIIIESFKIQEVIALSELTQMNAILKIESKEDEINVIPVPLLHLASDKEGKGKPAQTTTNPKTLERVTDELKYGLEITATDGEGYLAGDDNKIIFNVNIEEIDTETYFTSIYILDTANDKIRKVLYKGEIVRSEDEFNFYNKVFKEESIPINIKEIYPKSTKDSVFKDKLAGVNLGVANEQGPVVVIKEDIESLTTLSLAIKFFNTKNTKRKYNGKIVHIESLEIELPKGMSLVSAAGTPPCKSFNQIGNRWHLNDLSGLNKNLDKINEKTEDEPTKQHPIAHNCRIIVNPQEFFGDDVDLRTINWKYLIKPATVKAFMNFNYQVSKSGKIDVKKKAPGST